MLQEVRKEIEWNGDKLVLESGRIANLAGGSVLVSLGETVVLVTVTASSKPLEGADFIPMRVDYQEKFSAAGKIPGGFFKREGRPTEAETLVCRLIDRPVRPLIESTFHNDINIMCTVFSYDGKNDPMLASVIGTSCGLLLAGVPFNGPVVTARVGRIDDDFVVNPSVEERKKSTLDLVVAGTKDGVLMVESEACELSEEVMLDAIFHGHESVLPVITLIEELVAEKGCRASLLATPDDDELQLQKEATDYVISHAKTQLEESLKCVSKEERSAQISVISASLLAELDENKHAYAKKAIKKCMSDIMRSQVLDGGNRIDGRTLAEVRELDCRVDVLPKQVHGSSLFTRGETQVLGSATLGSEHDEQLIDSLEETHTQRFMLHYNFPLYSTGETGTPRGVSRREVGHGKLAWRALHPLLPSKDTFPYSIRVLAESTSSNGSTSMGSVCAGSMALMAAGVPLSRPCAGIAMGLIKEDERFAILSDILGDEDHLGDMDFKVAGTQTGITALQMDLKIDSVSKAIMDQALSQAKTGRLHILEAMNLSIKEARSELSPYAPQSVSLKIGKDRIKDVIGSGGKVIKALCEETGTRINVDDSGLVTVSGKDGDGVQRAITRIKEITAVIEDGAIYHGTVVQIKDYGLFVNVLPKQDGLVHISNIHIDKSQKQTKLTSVFKEGQKVWVKCSGRDNKGRVSLTMQEVDQSTGKEK